MAGKTVSPADAAAEPCTRSTVNEAGYTAGRYWQAAGHCPKTLFRTSSVEAVRPMVADGMGVTIPSNGAEAA